VFQESATVHCEIKSIASRAVRVQTSLVASQAASAQTTSPTTAHTGVQTRTSECASATAPGQLAAEHKAVTTALQASHAAELTGMESYVASQQLRTHEPMRVGNETRAMQTDELTPDACTQGQEDQEVVSLRVQMQALRVECEERVLGMQQCHTQEVMGLKQLLRDTPRTPRSRNLSIASTTSSLASIVALQSVSGVRAQTTMDSDATAALDSVGSARVELAAVTAKYRALKKSHDAEIMGLKHLLARVNNATQANALPYTQMVHRATQHVSHTCLESGTQTAAIGGARVEVISPAHAHTHANLSQAAEDGDSAASDAKQSTPAHTHTLTHGTTSTRPGRASVGVHVGLDGLQSEAIARIPVLESKICELSDALEASLHEKAALAAVVQSTMSLSHTQASTDSIEDALGTLIESLYVTVSNQQQSINALRAERDAIARARQEGRLRMDRTETRLLSLVESNETLQRTNQDLSDKLALAHISLRSACEEVSELTKKANPR
jgi:hypothetical protein